MMHSVKYRIPAVVVKSREEAVADRRQEILDDVLQDKKLPPDTKMDLYESGIVRRLNDENKLDRVDAVVSPEVVAEPSSLKTVKKKKIVKSRIPRRTLVKQDILSLDSTQSSSPEPQTPPAKKKKRNEPIARSPYPKRDRKQPVRLGKGRKARLNVVRW